MPATRAQRADTPTSAARKPKRAATPKQAPTPKRAATPRLTRNYVGDESKLTSLRDTDFDEKTQHDSNELRAEVHHDYNETNMADAELGRRQQPQQQANKRQATPRHGTRQGTPRRAKQTTEQQPAAGPAVLTSPRRVQTPPAPSVPDTLLDFDVEDGQTVTLRNNGQTAVDLGQFSLKAGRSERTHKFRRRSLKPGEEFKLFTGENAEELKRQNGSAGPAAVWSKTDVFLAGEEGQGPDTALLVANADGSTVLSRPAVAAVVAASPLSDPLSSGTTPKSRMRARDVSKAAAGSLPSSSMTMQHGGGGDRVSSQGGMFSVAGQVLAFILGVMLASCVSEHFVPQLTGFLGIGPWPGPSEATRMYAKAFIELDVNNDNVIDVDDLELAL